MTDQSLELTSSKDNSQSVSPRKESSLSEIGRPSKYTDEIIKSLVKSFEDGSTITEACNIAGISRQSYYDWMELHNDFSDKILIAQEYPDYVAKSLVVSAMKKGDVETGKWWLERRIKSEFSTRNELTGKDGSQLLPQPILGGRTKDNE